MEKKWSASYKELKDIYREYKEISDGDIMSLTSELYDCAFVYGGLTDIFLIVDSFESSMKRQGAKIAGGEEYYVYDFVLSILDINEKSARMVYENFLDIQVASAFYMLMDDFNEWLTKEEIDNVLELARDVFDKEIWESYV